MAAKFQFYKETAFKEIPELGIKVPEDWEVVALSQIFQEVSKKERQIILEKNKEYRFIVTKLYGKGVQLKEIKLGGHVKQKEWYVVRAGDFIFSKINAKKGAFGFIPPELDGAVVSNEHPILKLDRSKAIDGYVKYFMSLPIFWKYIERFSGGFADKSRIKTRQFLQLILPLPSLEEQKAIAEILSTMDKAIEKTQEAIEKTEKLKKGLMQKLLTGEIRIKEENGKCIFYKEIEFQDTEIGKIPKEWDVVRLEKCCTGFQYGLSVKLYDSGEIPVVKMDNIENGFISFEVGTVKYVNELDENTIKKYLLNYGDILINRTNAPDLVGKVGVFLLDKKCVFASYLIRITPIESKIDPLFLNYYLVFSHKRLKAIAKRAVSQANIDAKSLRLFKIPLPPLEEQKRIAEILMTVDKKIELLKKKKELLEEVKKWFMQKLLTGEIRVKIK